VRIPFCKRSEPTEYLTTIDEIMAAANEHGVIELTRFDRDLGKMVVDLIYDGMPAREVVL
jgi:hypothetical protein